MADMFEYLSWRGDISLAHSPFNAVDSLILSVLSYLPFDGIVPETIHKNGASLEDANDSMRLLDIRSLPIRDDRDIKLLSALARSERFKNMRLCAYVNDIDIEKEKQFSAITILTGDKHAFLAFRGTDLTLVGWKEDFNMSFLTTVPSQAAATEYLERVYGELRMNLRLGGHSKGGNLATYAAAFCTNKTQKHIQAVYNNDGPGFDSSIIESEGYRRVQGRLHSYVPQSSIIGMLLEHHEQYTIVQSGQVGLMQHDPYSWNILGTDFITLKKVSDGSKFVNRTLKAWVDSIEPAHRELFIEALYDILASTEATSLPELTENWFKSLKLAGKTLKSLDDSTRKSMHESLWLLVKATKDNLQTLMPSFLSGKPKR